jgi:hypothetical protein
MKFKVLEANCNGTRFRIEEDYPEIGAYLHLYEGEKRIRNFLTDSIPDCKKIAFETYGVAESQWYEGG